MPEYQVLNLEDTFQLRLASPGVVVSIEADLQDLSHRSLRFTQLG